MPLDLVRITYEHDHKCSMANDFIWVEKKALGSASLAQVHKVKCRRTGDLMALKIQYPNLRVQTKLDLFVIRRLIKLANWLCHKYDYKGIDFDKFLNHFEKGLLQELDFKSEVINS